MSTEAQFTQLLNQHGMVLIRRHNHRVYKHPDGTIFVTSRTPGDHKARMNQLKSLQKFLRTKIKTEATNERRYATW